MSIPLVQNNEKDSINTSIIAIKRNIERINMLLGLSNSEEIDTSEFVKKSDIVDVVEAGNMNPVTSNAVVPVDEVTSGNMQSITSNAVSEALNTISDEKVGILRVKKYGRVVSVFCTSPYTGASGSFVTTLPEKYRPTNTNGARVPLINNSNDTYFGQGIIDHTGVVQFYKIGGGSFSGETVVANWTYIV